MFVTLLIGMVLGAIIALQRVPDVTKRKPLAAASVRMARINTEKRTVPTSWHEDIAARTNTTGEISFVLNQPGWWCCMASIPGDPLKGPDGQPKPLQMGALFWLYVDSLSSETRKR